MDDMATGDGWVLHSRCGGNLLGSRLLLGIEIGSSDGEAEFEVGCKVASVEVGSGGWLLDHSNRALLLEQQQDVAVNSDGWTRPRV